MASLLAKNYVLHAAPTGSPHNVTVLEVMSDHATISWDPPHSDLHNGIIREYLLEVTEEKGGQTVIYKSGTTFSLIDNLHPDYSYTVRVAGHTVEVGPYSDSVDLHTLEDGMFKYSELHRPLKYNFPKRFRCNRYV